MCDVWCARKASVQNFVNDPQISRFETLEDQTFLRRRSLNLLRDLTFFLAVSFQSSEFFFPLLTIIFTLLEQSWSLATTQIQLRIIF